MLQKQSEIVILGAGIAGLTSAIALHQRGFHNIVVYERRNTALTIGAGLVLWANAIKILEKLNLFEELKKIGGKLDQMQRWTSQGDFLGAIDITKINAFLGAESYSISRSDFQKILLQKVEELNISINYGHNVEQLVSKGERTEVHFENKSSVNAALVLGAEGRMSSPTRYYVIGSNVPVYQGFINWIGVVETDQPFFNETSVFDYWGIGERFGLVPINAYKAYWAAGKALPQNSDIKYKAAKEEVLKLFRSWPPAINEAIALTRKENIKYIEVFDHHPNLKWHKGNVGLIGDAAHAALPTSGQGACQAIEDAWHFAAIAAIAPSIEEAFTAFYQLRFEKTTSITMAGRAFANSLFNEDLQYCKQRNEQAKSTDYYQVSHNMANLWSKNLPQ